MVDGVRMFCLWGIPRIGGGGGLVARDKGPPIYDGHDEKILLAESFEIRCLRYL